MLHSDDNLDLLVQINSICTILNDLFCLSRDINNVLLAFRQLPYSFVKLVIRLYTSVNLYYSLLCMSLQEEVLHVASH